MKNPKFEALNSLPCKRLFSFILQGEQYQSPNFPNLKRLGNLNLYSVSILDIKVYR